MKIPILHISPPAITYGFYIPAKLVNGPEIARANGDDSEIRLVNSVNPRP